MEAGDITTTGQFTCLFNGASSTLRRKGVQVATGDTGPISSMPNLQFSLGDYRTFWPLDGSIAFAAACCRAITTQQRDAIENLLNTKYYPSTIPAPPPPAIVADLFLDMAGQTVGTVVTAPILTSGTKGTIPGGTGWFSNPSTLVNIKVGANQITSRSPIQIGATTYPASSGDLSVAVDNGDNFQWFGLAQFSGRRVITVSGIIKLNVPNMGPASSLFDLVRFKGMATGQFAVFQLNNGSGGAGYLVNIETNPSGVTTHSPTIAVTPGATYWFSFQANFTSGVASLNLYQAPEWTLVGSITGTQTTGEDIGEIDIGNAEVGEVAGTSNYFQSLIFTYTSNVFPQGP
jgi:hypothetical protein